LRSVSFESIPGAMKAASALLLYLITDAALAVEVTPVQKVVQLLEGMSAKGKKRKAR